MRFNARDIGAMNQVVRIALSFFLVNLPTVITHIFKHTFAMRYYKYGRVLPLYTRIMIYILIHIVLVPQVCVVKKRNIVLNQLEINLNLIHCTKFNIITLIRFVLYMRVY